MTTRLAAAFLLIPMALPMTLSATLCAQADPAATVPSHRGPQPIVVSFAFEGGTMKQFVAAIRKDQPKANIVLATRASSAVVPPMVLRDAGVEQALEGACMAAEADFRVNVKEFRGAGQPVYSIYAIANQGRAGAAVSGHRPGDLHQRVLTLNDLTAERMSGMKPMKVETVLSAIELAMGDEDSPPRIRFHEDSGLLLVRGSYQQIEVVEQTIQTLGRDLDKREQRFVQRRQREQMEQAQGQQPAGGRRSPK
ncbi:MAG: hypothetical protein KAI24_12205 [Planctomycetes bacterium]|nr:hypothetical protein [Planctomycetota bacterium]